MSSDRETRRKLEAVQTRLVEIGPEIALAESPGFAEKVRALEQTGAAARERASEEEDKLKLARSEYESAQRAVEQMTLAVQAKQTNNPPTVLGLILLVVLMVAVVAGGVTFARYSHLFGAAGAAAFSMVSGALLGLVLRARADVNGARRIRR